MDRVPPALDRRAQSGLAALVLVALVLLLAMVPAMLLLQSAMERQRVLDAQVRAMLKGPPARPAQRPASAAQ
jgi:hypothetical protein